MGFTLLDRPNPHGKHYYPTRNQPLLAIVMHITAGAEDLDALADVSAENVAAYAGSTDRDVSWHTGSDTDSWVDLLPSTYTAWHASSYNSCTHGHEISKRHTDWRVMSEDWIARTLRMAALGPTGTGGLRAIALKYAIPFRKATRAELDEQRANYLAGRPWKPVGFISHAEVQPADRTDPGWVRGVDTFPWSRFFALLNKEDDVLTPSDGNTLWSATDDDGHIETLPVAEWVGKSTFRTYRLLLGQEVTHAMLSQILAGETGLDPEVVMQRTEAAARDGAQRGTEQAINGTVLPALRAVLVDVLGEDNGEQADAIVDRLGERLRIVAA